LNTAAAAAKKSQRRLRLITHPNFRNVTSREAEEALAPDTVEVGETILRPSSRSNSILIATVKAGPGLYLHLGSAARAPAREEQDDPACRVNLAVQRSGHGARARDAEIHEHDKANEWAIGRTLTIHDMRFDDLDEVRPARALDGFLSKVWGLCTYERCGLQRFGPALARCSHGTLSR